MSAAPPLHQLCTMQIFIEMGTYRTCLTVSPSDTIFRVKQKLNELDSIPVAQICLRRQGKLYNNDALTISEYGIQMHMTIEMSLKNLSTKK